MMTKTAIFVLADSETYEGLGRAFNALVAAKDLRKAGGEVKVVFDGAGTKWPAALSAPEHKAHALYQEVKGSVAGACSFCAGVFGVADAAKKCGTKLLDEFEGHPSVRALIEQGYQIVNF